jgi:hypothetical protein
MFRKGKAFKASLAQFHIIIIIRRGGKGENKGIRGIFVFSYRKNLAYFRSAVAEVLAKKQVFGGCTEKIYIV